MVVRCVQVVCCSGALCFGCAPPLGVILLITPRPPPSYISTGAHTTAPAHVPTLSPLPSRFPHTANNSFKNNSTPVRLLSIDYSSSEIVSVKFLSPNSPSTPAKMPPKKTESTKPEGAAAPKAKSTSSHPSYQAMITDAIINLKDRNGSSRQSLKKYVKANNKLEVTDAMFDSLFNKALRNGVEKGVFQQPKGPSGGTKLAKKVPAPKKEVGEKPKKVAAPKKAAAPKKEAAPKEKKETKEKKAAAPKEKKEPKEKKAAAAAAPKKEKKEPKEKKAAAPKKVSHTIPIISFFCKQPLTSNPQPVAEKALTKTKTGRVTKAAAAAKPAAKKATPVKKAATTKKSSAKKAAAEPAAAA
ncbi:hypothetical protein RB601_005165 [Gaeumannomyces tritici]